MNKHSLLKICRIQEIDLFFTVRGFSRTYVYKKIVYPNFFISKATYYEYLAKNAKAILKNKGIDWRKELEQIVPVNYMQLMREMQQRSLFDTNNNENNIEKIIADGCKH